MKAVQVTTSTLVENKNVDKMIHRCIICNSPESMEKMHLILYEEKICGSESVAGVTLERILNQELKEFTILSEVICQHCFSLLEDVEQTETRLMVLKRDIVGQYILTNQKITSPAASAEDYIPDLVQISNQEKQGRNVRNEKLSKSSIEVLEITNDAIKQNSNLNEEQRPQLIGNQSSDSIVDHDSNLLCNQESDLIGKYKQKSDHLQVTLDSLAEDSDASLMQLLSLQLEPNADDATYAIVTNNTGSTSLVLPLPLSEHHVPPNSVCSSDVIPESSHSLSHVLSQSVPSPAVSANQPKSKSGPKRKNTRHQCPHCPSSYASQVFLNEHINLHTGVRPYECTHCSSVFSQARLLKIHARTAHTEVVKPYECSICQRTFGLPYQLAAHAALHERSTDHKFMCEVCGAAVASARTLEAHAATHTNLRAYQCHECGGTFRHRSNLIDHLRLTHQRLKKYACSQCKRAYTRRCLLDYHVKSAHTGERPFVCTACSATFLSKQHLQKHARTHDTAADTRRAYDCQNCERSFSTRENLKAHMYTHSSLKPYECALCSTGFMRKAMCIRHIELDHVTEHSDAHTYIKTNPVCIPESFTLPDPDQFFAANTSSHEKLHADVSIEDDLNQFINFEDVRLVESVLEADRSCVSFEELQHSFATN